MKPTALIKDDFKNLLDYQTWLKDAFINLSPLNTGRKEYFGKESTNYLISQRKKWFGEGASYVELQAGVKEYARPDLLDKIYLKVQHELQPVVKDRLKARKMKFNALGFGMFSFERAAMTMFRNEEYYSPSLNAKVDFRDIKKDKGGFMHASDSSKVIKRWEQKPDGTAKIRTQTKELFAYFPEVSRDRHAVELYISCNAASSKTSEEMLYGGVSAVILAELLIKVGIRVKINVLMGSAVSANREKYVGCLIPVKQYEETLDRNIIALLSCDPRFMRYDGFKGIVASYDNFQLRLAGNYGYPMGAKEMETMLEDSGYTKKSKAAHRYYFGGTFTEDEALSDINNAIEDIASHLKK